MDALFAGLTTFDVVHLLDHAPDVRTKTTSTAHFTGAGGPATNAAITFAALDRIHGGRDTRPGLLTALGDGPTASAMRSELESLGVDVLDATDLASTAVEPAISSAVEHPAGRFVASTNARVPVDGALARRLLTGAVDRSGPPRVVLADGHQPALAALALQSSSTGASGPQRILDGGSWKPAFTPLLEHVDVAVVSADFAPPGTLDADGAVDGAAVLETLRRHGIDKVVRTDGPEPVTWWWQGRSGRLAPPATAAVSTTGAGDVFHGAFAWALARLPGGGPADATDPSAAIAFASRIAALSTRSFGTREWIQDPQLRTLTSTGTAAGGRSSGA